MSMYCLYGIVGKSRDLFHKSLEYPGAGVVHLEQGIGMIPISEELLNAIEQGETSLRATAEPGFEFLSEVMLAWVRLSLVIINPDGYHASLCLSDTEVGDAIGPPRKRLGMVRTSVGDSETRGRGKL